MKVKVQLYAILAKYLPSNAENKTAILELAEGTTVKGILEELKIPEAMPKILLVNGRNAELDKVVVEGDIISVFPPIAGGERKWGHPLKGPCQEKRLPLRKKWFFLQGLPVEWTAPSPLPQFLSIQWCQPSLHQSPIRMKVWGRSPVPLDPFRMMRTRKSSVPCRVQI